MPCRPKFGACVLNDATLPIFSYRRADVCDWIKLYLLLFDVVMLCILSTLMVYIINCLYTECGIRYLAPEIAIIG